MVQVHQLKHHLPSAEALLTGGHHGSDQDRIFCRNTAVTTRHFHEHTNKDDNVVAVTLRARHSRCPGLVTFTPNPTVTDSDPND